MSCFCLKVAHLMPDSMQGFQGGQHQRADALMQSGIRREVLHRPHRRIIPSPNPSQAALRVQVQKINTGRYEPKDTTDQDWLPRELQHNGSLMLTFLRGTKSCKAG